MARRERSLLYVAAVCACACVVSARPDHNNPHPVQKLETKISRNNSIISSPGSDIFEQILLNTLFTGGKYVLAGTNNSEDGSGVSRRVKQLYVHPRFAVGPYWLNAKRYNIKQVAARFDYLLAELEEPLELNGVTIAAAELNELQDLPAGINVGYAGYGAEHHGETMRHEMHGMDLSLLAEEECARLEEYDSQDMICIRGRAPRYDSACNGDSGSGIVDENGVLIGIASWVENDALECRNGATVYCSKVATARPWIRKITGI
ncbi:Scolexin B [Papilio machaon]|uniref:Scolexin B n=1 Tax=Papilio machaon TaxID=76193 RepID=A0A0N0PC69_PAPMA|nr:Scolexin B [Papilio machaon]